MRCALEAKNSIMLWIWIVPDSMIWLPPREASGRCVAVRAGENEDEIFVVVVVAVAKHGLLG
jgi:hypothetical protein